MPTQKPPTITSLARTLGNLSAGQRAWFWCCPHAEPPAPALVLMPFEAGDPKQMYDSTAGIPLPLGRVPAIGIAAVDFDGRLHLASMSFEGSDLPRLAAWTKEHLPDHPEFTRLGNASLIKLSPSNQIVERFEDPELWAGIPTPTVPGTTAAALQQLGQLTAGHRVLFWMTDKGPSGRPFLWIEEPGSHPDAFSVEVSALQRSAPSAGTSATGYVKVQNNHELLFVSTNDSDVGTRLLQRLRDAYTEAVEVLNRTAFHQLSDTPEHARRVSLSALSKMLGTLHRHEAPVFWFTKRDRHNGAMLVIAKSKDELKKQARLVGGNKDATRGRIRLAADGSIVFRTTKQDTGLIEQLKSFVSTHHAAWPRLRILKNASVSLRAEGPTHSKDQIRSLWKDIPSI